MALAGFNWRCVLLLLTWRRCWPIELVKVSLDWPVRNAMRWGIYNPEADDVDTWSLSLALWLVCLLPWDVRCLRVLDISALLCKHQREFPSWTRRYHDTNRDFFIWRQDSSQMYFILFVFSIFQVQDGDGGEQTWEIEVYSASGLMCIWHQDREELLHLITRRTWVLFIGFWERGVWRLTFYRWADLCRLRLIVCTVRCHSYPRAHTQCLFCWYTGVKQQQSYQGRMTTWFCWGIGWVTVYGDENVSEIVQTLHFPC